MTTQKPAKKAGKKSPGPELIRGMKRLRDGLRKSKCVRRFRISPFLNYTNGVPCAGFFTTDHEDGEWVTYTDHVAALGRSEPSDRKIEEIRKECERIRLKYFKADRKKEAPLLGMAAAASNILRILNRKGTR